jgi:eukaryotic-like serine/threonine-protein kinase
LLLFGSAGMISELAALSDLELVGFSPGDLLAGRYRIARVIGRGGMGLVLEALHVDLGERVAVKVLLPEFAANAEVAERFMQEARTSAKLRSPHVARVFDFGLRDDGSAYLVMDFLEGETLGARIERVGALPIVDALTILYQACLGIAEAHDMRLIHRDIKPDNLFLEATRDGRIHVKVLDFGIAKKLDEPENVRLTRTGALVGTPLYMSPEQLRASGVADVRSDVWALGSVLYEALTGAPPFMAPSISDLVLQIAQDPALDPRGVRAEISTELAELVLRCLAKAPDLRPHSARGIAEIIARLLEGLAHTEPPHALGSASSLPLQVRSSSAISLPARSPEAGNGSVEVEPQQVYAAGNSLRAAAAATLHGVTHAASPPKRKWGWVVASTFAALAIVGVALARVVAPSISPVRGAPQAPAAVFPGTAKSDPSIAQVDSTPTSLATSTVETTPQATPSQGKTAWAVAHKAGKPSAKAAIAPTAMADPSAKSRHPVAQPTACPPGYNCERD